MLRPQALRRKTRKIKNIKQNRIRFLTFFMKLIKFTSKILNFFANYYWVVFILGLIVLFTPADLAKAIGLESIKQQNELYWWLALVFSGALLVRDLLYYIAKK